MHADPSASANEMPTEAGRSAPVFLTLAALERRTIVARIIAFDGNKSAAAKSLGISLKTLYNRLNEYKAADAEGSAT